MIILVRHGEATHHTQHLTGGWTNSELTEFGIKQMERTAYHLSRFFQGKLLTSPLRILTSDLERAKQSSGIVAKALNFSRQIESFEFLREKCNGEAANLTEEEAKRIYSKPAPGPQIDHRNYPGGETRREFFQRTIAGVEKNIDLVKDNAVIISHKGTIQNILFHWLGMDLEEAVKRNISFSIDAASYTILDFNRWGERSIERLNCK